MSNTVLPPIEGDAAVIRIKGTSRGLALKTDCNPRYVFLDPRLGGQHAVAEAARNVAVTGAKPVAMTNCLNFGNPERPDVYYQLEQAVTGMAEAARGLDTPIVSGNVSLYNETGGTPVLPTPVVGMVGVIDNVERYVGMAAAPGSRLLLLGARQATIGASEYLAQIHSTVAGPPPPINLDIERRVQSTVVQVIDQGLIVAAHDCSEGGLLVAVAEMLISGGIGARLSVKELVPENGSRLDRTLFGEAASRILVCVPTASVGAVRSLVDDAGLHLTDLGEVQGSRLEVDDLVSVPIEDLSEAWRSGLRV